MFRFFCNRDHDEGYSHIVKMLQLILQREETLMAEFDDLKAAVGVAVSVEHDALVKIQDDVTKLAADVVQIADLVAQLAAATNPAAMADLTAQLTVATDQLKAGIGAVVVPVPVVPVP